MAALSVAVLAWLLVLICPPSDATASLLGRRLDAGQGGTVEIVDWEMATGRHLQNLLEDGPTVVNSYADLAQALADGKNIEIRSHIDARADEALPPVNETTRSIRGNCAGDLSDEMKSFVDSDLPLGQCMILAYAKQASPVITVTAHTWIDNIYFVEGTIPAPNVQVGPLILVKEPVGQIWVTQSTIQGAQQVDGVSLNQKGLEIRGSAFLSGSRLRRLGGTVPVIDVGPNNLNPPYVSLSNVLFDQNYGPVGEGTQWGGVDALIHVDSGNLRLEDCSFPQNPHKYPVAVKDPGSRVYAQPQVTVQLPAGDSTVTQPSLSLGDIPAAVTGNTLFPSERSPLYVALEQALPSRPAPQATDKPEDDNSFGLSQGAHGAHSTDLLHNLPDGDMNVAPADVWEVSTAQELVDGVTLGYRDIVIKAHLDMSAVKVDDLGFVLTLLPATRSMQGKCDGNATIPASLTSTPNPPGNVPAGTCVLGAEEGLLRLPSSNHFFWMDSIHLHAIPAPPGTQYIDDQTAATNPTTGPNMKWSRRFLDVSGSGSLVFLSNVRMFGDTAGTAAVTLSDASAAMHIEDSTFQNMNVPKSSNAILRTRGALSLSNCALNKLTAVNASTAIVLAEHSGSLTLHTQPPSQQCNGNVYALADNAAVFADEVPDSRVYYCKRFHGPLTNQNAAAGDQVLNINAATPEEVTPSAAPADTTAALSLNHPWLVALKASLAKPQSVEDVSLDDGDYSYDLDIDDAHLTDSLPSDTLKGGPVQLDPPADVRSVGNAEELVRALEQSVLDIVITKHIDLRGINRDMLSFFLTVGMNTRSIRGGECEAVEGSWVEGENLQPPISGATIGQCVLLADFGVFHVFSHNHNIWFDQIFVRFVPPPDGNDSLQRDAFMISGQGSTAFMTGITVQGSGAQQTPDSIGEGVLVISTNSSGAHMHGALFQDLRVLNADNSFIKTAGHLSLNNTVFQNVAAPAKKALIFVQSTGKLRLAKVTFGPNASGTQVFVEGNVPNVWAMDPQQKVRDSVTGQEATAPGLAAIPSPSPFTSLSNKWLQTLIAGLKQDSESPFVGLNPDEPGRAELFRTPSGKSGSSSSSNSTRSTIAAISGVLAVLLLAVVAVVFAVRRYRARRDNGVTANGAFRRAWVENSSFSVISEGHGKQPRDSNNGKNRKLESNGIPASPAPGATGMFSNGFFGIFGANKKQKTEEPAPKLRHVPTTLGHKHDSLGLDKNAALSVPLQPLVKALDALCAEKTFFLDVYVALGPASRKIGRDAVVQIFQHRMNKSRVAVKFYRTRATFDRERALRTNGDLSPICVPKIRTLADPGIGPGGYTWPPCIVLECGMNLVTYLNHVEQNDGEGSAYPTACAVVAEIAELVELMHEVGFAHRKLRPENVMYIPERDAWSLTDIDRATRVGLMNAPAPPTEYTAPEVWKAMQLARTCLTTAAADVWAVGALAYELSTGERVLMAGSTPKEAAMGLKQRAQAAADAGRLGSIKDVILECLAEDPQMRPTAQSIVPVLEAETERAKIDLKMLKRELAQLSEHAEGYTQARVFLLAVCKTPLLPQAARSKLQEPPEQQPTATEFKSIIQQYCMALGPDTVTLPKGLPFRKERLDALKDINAMLNTVLKTTKL